MTKKLYFPFILLLVLSMMLGACAPAAEPVVEETQAPVMEQPVEVTEAPVVEVAPDVRLFSPSSLPVSPPTKALAVSAL